MLRKIRESFEPRELVYPSNLLSLVRILLIWPTIRYLLEPRGRYKALGMIALGMATDVVDGPLARARGEVSGLGKLLDPIADKVTLNAVALSLARRNKFPRWVTYLLLARDAGILAGSTLIFRRSSYIATSVWAGKATTIALTGTLLLYILDAHPWARRLLNLTLVPLAISWGQYALRYRDWLRSAGASAGTNNAPD
ncbi:MAG TPA: CDP-alcohol phosphatidyltransferase family protein [Herpetosiphonaceae bacterium]|nr:CDP-alcohol phosphatidyltransferase family protein [Herpetosiphonaceae bacterium]